MVGIDDIVITGLGCVTPIGIGRAAFEQALFEGQCAVRKHVTVSNAEQTTLYSAVIDDFSGKHYVKPRKAIKVMNREVQVAYSAAALAWEDAGLEGQTHLDPDRVSVIYGSEMLTGEEEDLVGATIPCFADGEFRPETWGESFKEIYPLWMLKNLPNMPACHVGIAIDARGPNNTIAQEEVSGLLALNEAVHIMERGHADVVVVGAVGGRVSPARLAYRPWRLYDQHPSTNGSAQQNYAKPFDVHCQGIVPSEASAALVLERRSRAVKRGAMIWGRVAGLASRCAKPKAKFTGSEKAVASAARAALAEAGMDPEDLSHINAQGFAQRELDAAEAQAIQSVAPDVPVTAFSSYFGTAGAGCALVELTASLLSLRHNQILPTLNTQELDPATDLKLCTTPITAEQSPFLKLSLTPFGHAAAAVIEAEAGAFA